MEELTIRSEQDVAQYVKGREGDKSSWLIVFVALGGIFIDAYDTASMGIGVPQIRAAFHLSSLDMALITSIMMVGGMLGAMWGGYLTDKLGRYKLFLTVMVILAVAALGCGLSINVWMFVFFRFVMGFGIALDLPVSLAFIAEYVNQRQRGAALNVWMPTFWVAQSSMGLVVLPFYLYTSIGDNLWRVAVGFGVLPAILLLILRNKLMDESPMWAAHNLGLPEAARILNRIYGVKVTVIRDQQAELPKTRISPLELFRPRYIRRLILTTCISVPGSIQYFAITFSFPAISMLLFGNKFIYAILGSIFLNCFGIIGGSCSVWRANKTGYRKEAIIGYATCFICLAIFGLGGTAMPLAFRVFLIAAFVWGHTFGPAPNGNTMAALAFPTRIRATAVGWSYFSSRFGAIFGFFLFFLGLDKFGLSRLVLWTALVPLIGLIGSLAINYEPIGKDIEAEDVEFRRQELAATAAATDGRQ